MLLPEDADPMVHFQNYNKAFEEIRKLLYGNSSIQDIYLYEDDIHSVHCGILQTAISFTEEELDMMDSSIGGWFWSTSDNQLSMCRMIRNIYDVNERVAYLKIIIDKSDFLTFFSGPNMTDDIYFAMSDQFGNILTDNLPDEYVWLLDNFKSMDMMLSHSGSYYQCSDSPVFQAFPIDLTKNHTVITAFSKDYARQYRQIIILILVSLIILFTVIALFQYSFYNRFVLKPIIGLSYMMEQIEQNQFSGRFQKETVKELQPVITKFNNMSKKLEYLYTEVYRNNLKLKDAQIRSLQKEINPHFYTIRWIQSVG